MTDETYFDPETGTMKAVVRPESHSDNGEMPPVLTPRPVDVPEHIARAAAGISPETVVSAATNVNEAATPTDPQDTTLAGFNARLTAVEQKLANAAIGAVAGPAAPIVDEVADTVIKALEPRVQAVEQTVASHVPIIGKVMSFFGL